MVAPMVLAAGIGAAGSALGGVMGGKGAKKAAKVAAKAQTKIAEMNNALVQWNYGQNAARLDPYVQQGTRAGNVLMELLLGPSSTGGGGGGGGGTAAPAGPSALQSEWNRILGYQNDGIGGNFTPAAEAWIAANASRLPSNYSGPSWQQIQAYQNDGIKGNYEPAMLKLGNAIAAATATAPTAPQGATNSAGKPISAASAWDQFRNSTNYKWQLQQGLDAVSQGFAGSALDSGAARLAMNDYAQNQAMGALGNWMNMLAGQQGIGLQAGSALAGVGTAGMNAQMANNWQAGNAQSNAALIAGQANQNMWGTIGQGIGQVAGAWGSSYNQPQSPYTTSPIVTSYNNPAYGGGSAWGY